jgi:tetratricopeptide (TPR) repeat protein
MRWRLGMAAAGLAGLLFGACDRAEDRAADEQAQLTRAIMLEIVEAMRVALPASSSPMGFREPARRDQVAASLAALAQHAAFLEEHARDQEEPERFLARDLARDARDTAREYAEGHYDRAAFLLHEITENCVVCHTRLPSEADSPLAERLLDARSLAALPPEGRATLQIATRRFDEALATLESLLVDPAVHPALLMGPITDYLVLTLRVKRDFQRPVPTLERFAARPDLWTRLRMEVEGWIAALPGLQQRSRGKPELATARALIDEARQMSLYPDDRTPLAHLVVASSILQRYIDTHRPADRKLAEAYYLLGVTEARIGRNYWVTPAPYLLQQAIRLAPSAPFAIDAYALLERELLMSYEGSDWEELPDDETQRLEELRELMAGGSGAGAGSGSEAAAGR